MEAIEARLEARGPDAVSLDELREVTLYRRGPERLAEIQQQARERATQSTTTNSAHEAEPKEN